MAGCLRSFRLPMMLLVVVAVAAMVLTPTSTKAEVCNIKVVTDANPDYSDIGSMLYSITSNWSETKDKCWAIFYWNHIARRQTAPFKYLGRELTDPIRQFNDYGYTMCSTIAGNNCAIFSALGLNVRFWDISMHTVMDVEYDGGWHMFDNSLSALYTRCDGKTLASVTEIGQEGSCEASGGKVEPGHIAKYHCLYSTSPNGYLSGCDGIRSVAEEYKCFNPPGLKHRFYFNNWDLGHRYILNLRDSEVYTRYYHRLDEDSPKAVVQTEKRPNFKADPAYFVPNGGTDPEAVNPRYGIRGNGVRTWAPALTADGLAKEASVVNGVKGGASGVEPSAAGTPGQVVFKVEGANVITSLAIKAAFARKTADDVAAIEISTNNGITWQEVYKAQTMGDVPADVELLKEVNGSYAVLVKVTLAGKAAGADARLKSIAFDTITMVNSKTQPSLRLGKNTVYVAAGDQTESIVFSPDLQGQAYKKYVVDEANIKTEDTNPNWRAVMFQDKEGEDSYVVFRMDAPGDLTKITYGGRWYVHVMKAHAEMLHSFDDGKTWTKAWSSTDTTFPWDTIQYVKDEKIPAGTRSVLFKYSFGSAKAGSMACGLYAVQMEGNYKPADTTQKPMEVTFAWKERQEDYTTVLRSHTQLVEKLPAKYEINVGGADHPIVESLTVNLAGARKAVATQPADAGVKYGYSDGKDVGGQKWSDRWVTYGKNLAEGKPYTCSEKSINEYGAGDPDGKKLTDGIVGSTYTTGVAYKDGPMFKTDAKPVITVDLGKSEKCAAFRIHVGGFPLQDGLKGEIKDKIEVQTSADDKTYTSQGFFDARLRWKDLPVNFMWPDQETLQAPNLLMIAPKPVEARYVRFILTPSKSMSVTEVQVLDSVKYDSFDLKIAPPDGKNRSDITAYPLKHVSIPQVKGDEKPAKAKPAKAEGGANQ